MKFQRERGAAGLKLVAAVAVIAVCALAALILLPRRTSANPVAPAVDTAPSAAPDAVIADGTLAYRSEVALTSEILGAVASVEVEEGQRVEAGDVLMRLRADQFVAQLAQRKAALEAGIVALDAKLAAKDLARTRFRRMESLYAQRLVSSSDLEEADAAARQATAEHGAGVQQVIAARAAVDEVSDSLRKTDVRSPITGTVLSVDVAVGETAVPSTVSFSGSTVARIADTRLISATARLGEYDVWKIKPGVTARVVVPALDDASFSGTVRTVALAPDRAGQTAPAGGALYQVVVDIDNADGKLRTGMTCRVEFAPAATTRNTVSVLSPAQAQAQ